MDTAISSGSKSAEELLINLGAKRNNGPKYLVAMGVIVVIFLIYNAAKSTAQRA